METKVAIIGLDTSHAVEFPKRMQAPDCPESDRVAGLRAVTCLRFPTPFQSEEGLDARQKTLEGWGVKVTTDFDEAVADCDAIMIEINDPSYHLEYFRRCAPLGKPVFIDKPLAESIESGREIYRLAQEHGTRAFSSSPLRFSAQLEEAAASLPEPIFAGTYGPLGKAPAGSSVVWYGVHSFEMLERAMGRGAESLVVVPDRAGATAVVEYADGRRGIVELSPDAWIYGGYVRSKEQSISFCVDSSRFYTEELRVVAEFFKTGDSPATLEDALEVMAMLDAAEHSFHSGERMKVEI